VKTSMKRISLAIALSLALGFALPAGLRGWERPVLAQAAGSASTPEAQSPAKDEQEQDENDAYRKSPMVEKLGGMMGMNIGPGPRPRSRSSTSPCWPPRSATHWRSFLPKAIRNRNTAIQKHLVDARTATEEARIRLSGVEARLAKLDGEIAGMRSQAEQDTAKEEQRVKSNLEEETKKILASAEQEIAAATLHARKLLQQQAAELAIEQGRAQAGRHRRDRSPAGPALRPAAGRQREEGAELMAVALALRYAHAFADVAESAKLDSSAAQAQLRDFADTAAGSRELRELFKTPSIEQASKLKVLDAIAARLGMFVQVRNFLAVIIEHGRLNELNEILDEYREIANADSGSVEAKITTAHPLDDAGRAQLEAQVTRMAGANVRPPTPKTLRC